MDDEALVHRMLRGDERAFDEFFDAYYDRVFRFAARRTGEADTAEDIAQATLVQAVRRLDTWRGEAALFTWLCSICRRELLAHFGVATLEAFGCEALPHAAAAASVVGRRVPTTRTPAHVLSCASTTSPTNS